MITLNKSDNFVSFCTEFYRQKSGMSGSEVIEFFRAYSIFEFLKDHYEVLHSQSLENTVLDINEYSKNQDKNKK